MQAILFPTDFSKRANQALNHAVDLTEKTESKLIIYHVYHRPVLKEASQKELDHALYSLELRIDLKFKKLLDHNTKLRRIKYEFVKELGVSIENIVKITEKESIDLIITATKALEL